MLGAAVTLTDGPVGFFSIGGLPTPGTFTVTFQKVGYLPATATAALAENGNETALSPCSSRLPAWCAGVVDQEIPGSLPARPRPAGCRRRR